MNQFAGKWNASIDHFYRAVQFGSSNPVEWAPLTQKIEIGVDHSRCLGAHWIGALGYTWKMDTPFESLSSDHTFSQHLTYLANAGASRFAHRFRLDERLKPSGNIVFRPRYRISWETPLEGDRLDEGEWYFVIEEEIVPYLRNGEDDFENRLIAAFGRTASSGQKWEFGLEHRMDNIFEQSTHELYLTVDYILKTKPE